MAVTITSENERETIRLDFDLPRDAKRLVLVDREGREYHFGCGSWTPNGTFVHVATYTTNRREQYASWTDVLDGQERGWEYRAEPQLGPRISPLVETALRGLAESCNFSNGFYGEPEKKWAVERLRALWEEVDEPLDPDEIAVWAAPQHTAGRSNTPRAFARSPTAFVTANASWAQDALFGAIPSTNSRWSPTGAGNYMATNITDPSLTVCLPGVDADLRARSSKTRSSPTNRPTRCVGSYCGHSLGVRAGIVGFE